MYDNFPLAFVSYERFEDYSVGIDRGDFLSYNTGYNNPIDNHLSRADVLEYSRLDVNAAACHLIIGLTYDDFAPMRK